MKKYFLLMVSLIVFFSLVAGLQISAYAAPITQEEAVDWVSSLEGQYFDVDGNGLWCTDLATAYINYLWLQTNDDDRSPFAIYHPYTTTTARLYDDYLNGNPNWTIIERTSTTVPQPGDLFVSEGGENGHVGVILEVYGSTSAKIIQMDGGKKPFISTVTWGSTTWYQAEHFIRFNYFKESNQAPYGYIDSVTGGIGTITVYGWALDPDSDDAVEVQVYLDGTCDGGGTLVKSGTASNSRLDGYPGYSITFSADPGTHSVYLYAIDTQGGTDAQLQLSSGVSRSVTVQEGVTITYNANGGSGAPDSATVAKGEKTKLSSTTPTRTNCTFLGWSTSNTATSATYKAGASYTPTADVTLYAVWDQYAFTIQYNANGGSGKPANQTKQKTKDLTLSSTIPTRDGYTFLGWATSKKATSATYQPGGTFTTNKDTTLYAVWKWASETVDVTFTPYEKTSGLIQTTYIKDTRAALGHKVVINDKYKPTTSDCVGIELYSANGTALATKTKSWNTSVLSSLFGNSSVYIFNTKSNLKITLTEGTRYKYRFFAKLDGKTYYGDYITFTTTGDATLGATKPTYTVSFDLNGHGEAISSQTIKTGDIAIEPDSPIADGYAFGGWYKEANCENAWDFETEVTTDTVLYAKWTAVVQHIDADHNGYCDECGEGPLETPAGDINGDIRVDSKDLIRLVKYELDSTVEYYANPDVNGSGNVDLSDVVHLLRYLIDHSTELFNEADELDEQNEQSDVDGASEEPATEEMAEVQAVDELFIEAGNETGETEPSEAEIPAAEDTELAETEDELPEEEPVSPDEDDLSDLEELEKDGEEIANLEILEPALIESEE